MREGERERGRERGREGGRERERLTWISAIFVDSWCLRDAVSFLKDLFLHCVFETFFHYKNVYGRVRTL